MKRRRIYLWIVIIGIISLIAMRSYGRVIYALYGEDIPTAWSADLLRLSHGELARRLGPPDYGMPVKGYQYWEKRQWWGRYELQIGYLDCCTDQSSPADIHVAVYVTGKYHAASYKAIAP